MSSLKDSERDWKACADWLVRCGLIPADHHVTGPNAQFSDLVILLRDGVLLCRLLNLLEPGSVDPASFSQHPQTSLFLYKRNVRTFLDTCKNTFGLSSRDLFDSFDLMGVENFGFILLTLSKLSQSPLALKYNNRPFQLSEKRDTGDYVNIKSMDYSEEEDIYGDNGEQDTAMQLVEEDIYGRLMNYVKSPSVSQPDTRHETKSDMCIRELITTEQSYVDVLAMMVESFMKPLKTILTLTDHGIIFRKFEELLDIHVQFLAVLKTAHSNESFVTISDCFIMFKEKFLVYADFCSNLPKAQKSIERVCKTSQYIKQSIQKCEKEASNSHFKLMDHLIVPMQRVLKYSLFLKEIAKFNEGEKKWTTALAEIEDLSLFVNEVKRDNEVLENLELIEASICGLPKQDGRTLKDYGRLQMDGELKLKAKKTKSMHVLLVDQMFLICTPQKDRDEFERYIPVRSVELDGSITMDKSISSHTFSVRVRGSSEEIYVFGAKTKELAMKWIRAIKLALDNVSPEFAHSYGHDFVMWSFSSPTICDVCRKLLRGTFFQGYKCSVTQMAVHKECIEKAKDAEMPKIPPRGSNSVEKSQRLNSGPSKGPSTPTNQRLVSQSRIGGSADVFRDPNGTSSEYKPSVTTASPVNWQPGELETSRSSHDFVNDAVSFDNCYAGNIDRAEAESILANKPLGTFLVRISLRAGELIMSLNGTDRVRHVIINKTPEGHCFFKPNHKFSTLNDLVKYYQRNYLAELSTLLGTPQTHADGIGSCTVLYNYSAMTPNQLSLKQGDKITILSKAREQYGLWKGKLGSQVGYFPYTYVAEARD